jgi:hypothetical protein
MNSGLRRLEEPAQKPRGQVGGLLSADVGEGQGRAVDAVEGGQGEGDLLGVPEASDLLPSGRVTAGEEGLDEGQGPGCPLSGRFRKGEAHPELPGPFLGSFVEKLPPEPMCLLPHFLPIAVGIDETLPGPAALGSRKSRQETCQKKRQEKTFLGATHGFLPLLGV